MNDMIPTLEQIQLGQYFPQVIDSSMMGRLKSCEQLFNKIYIEQWKPKGLSVHLHAGGCFAKGVEVARTAFYTGIYEEPVKVQAVDPNTGELETGIVYQPVKKEEGDAHASIANGLSALMRAYGDYSAPESGSGSAKSLDRMVGALEFYFENYPLTFDSAFPIQLAGGKRGIEYSFIHPLPINHPVTGNPILYTGRMDAILNYAGDVFIFDEKTASSLGPTWSRQWGLRSQFTGYAWGCREAGIRTAGVVVRGISILKTKYETQEAISYRPNWQIDRWYTELLAWVQQALVAWSTSGWKHNLDHSCAEYGGCAFRTACEMQDPKPLLSTYFEQRHWSPVTRKETLVLSETVKEGE